MTFKEYLFNEALFKYADVKYIDAVIQDIRNGTPLKLGKFGKIGTAIIIYDDDVKALENDHSLVKSTIFKSASGEEYKFTHFFKGTYSGFDGRTGAKGSERQENGIIELIKKSIEEFGEITIPGLTGPGEFVTDAYKKTGKNDLGQEPYIDIYVQTNKNNYGVSCKADDPASLAGGGILGLQSIDSNFVDDIFKKLIKKLDDMGYTDGTRFNYKDMPDFAYKIPRKYLKSILVGNKTMGGPIDSMYVGPMTVTAQIDKNKLIFNGKFSPIGEYVKHTPDLYVRIRQRDTSKFLDKGIIKLNDRTAKTNMPIVFGNTNSKTQTHLRIVIIDHVSKNTVKLN